MEFEVYTAMTTPVEITFQAPLELGIFRFGHPRSNAKRITVAYPYKNVLMALIGLCDI
jgi:hypothetical protein